jgi:hypothetical protein
MEHFGTPGVPQPSRDVATSKDGEIRSTNDDEESISRPKGQHEPSRGSRLSFSLEKQKFWHNDDVEIASVCSCEFHKNTVDKSLGLIMPGRSIMMKLGYSLTKYDDFLEPSNQIHDKDLDDYQYYMNNVNNVNSNRIARRQSQPYADYSMKMMNPNQSLNFGQHITAQHITPQHITPQHITPQNFQNKLIYDRNTPNSSLTTLPHGPPPQMHHQDPHQTQSFHVSNLNSAPQQRNNDSNNSLYQQHFLENNNKLLNPQYGSSSTNPNTPLYPNLNNVQNGKGNSQHGSVYGGGSEHDMSVLDLQISKPIIQQQPTPTTFTTKVQTNTIIINGTVVEQPKLQSSDVRFIGDGNASGVVVTNNVVQHHHHYYYVSECVNTTNNIVSYRDNEMHTDVRQNEPKLKIQKTHRGAQEGDNNKRKDVSTTQQQGQFTSADNLNGIGDGKKSTVDTLEQLVNSDLNFGLELYITAGKNYSEYFETQANKTAVTLENCLHDSLLMLGLLPNNLVQQVADLYEVVHAVKQNLVTSAQVEQAFLAYKLSQERLTFEKGEKEYQNYPILYNKAMNRYNSETEYLNLYHGQSSIQEDQDQFNHMNNPNFSRPTLSHCSFTLTTPKHHQQHHQQHHHQQHQQQRQQQQSRLDDYHTSKLAHINPTRIRITDSTTPLSVNDNSFGSRININQLSRGASAGGRNEGRNNRLLRGGLGLENSLVEEDPDDDDDVDIDDDDDVNHPEYHDEYSTELMPYQADYNSYHNNLNSSTPSSIRGNHHRTGSYTPSSSNFLPNTRLENTSTQQSQQREFSYAGSIHQSSYSNSNSVSSHISSQTPFGGHLNVVDIHEAPVIRQVAQKQQVKSRFKYASPYQPRDPRQDASILQPAPLFTAATSVSSTYSGLDFLQPPLATPNGSQVVDFNFSLPKYATNQATQATNNNNTNNTNNNNNNSKPTQFHQGPGSAYAPSHSGSSHSSSYRGTVHQATGGIRLETGGDQYCNKNHFVSVGPTRKRTYKYTNSQPTSRAGSVSGGHISKSTHPSTPAVNITKNNTNTNTNKTRDELSLPTTKPTPMIISGAAPRALNVQPVSSNNKNTTKLDLSNVNIKNNSNLDPNKAPPISSVRNQDIDINTQNGDNSRTQQGIMPQFVNIPPGCFVTVDGTAVVSKNRHITNKQHKPTCQYNPHNWGKTYEQLQYETLITKYYLQRASFIANVHFVSKKYQIGKLGLIQTINFETECQLREHALRSQEAVLQLDSQLELFNEYLRKVKDQPKSNNLFSGLFSSKQNTTNNTTTPLVPTTPTQIEPSPVNYHGNNQSNYPLHQSQQQYPAGQMTSITRPNQHQNSQYNSPQQVPRAFYQKDSPLLSQHRTPQHRPRQSVYTQQSNIGHPFNMEYEPSVSFSSNNDHEPSRLQSTNERNRGNPIVSYHRSSQQQQSAKLAHQHSRLGRNYYEPSHNQASYHQLQQQQLRLQQQSPQNHASGQYYNHPPQQQRYDSQQNLLPVSREENSGETTQSHSGSESIQLSSPAMSKLRVFHKPRHIQAQHCYEPPASPVLGPAKRLG